MRKRKMMTTFILIKEIMLQISTRISNNFTKTNRETMITGKIIAIQHKITDPHITKAKSLLATIPAHIITTQEAPLLEADLKDKATIANPKVEDRHRVLVDTKRDPTNFSNMKMIKLTMIREINRQFSRNLRLLNQLALLEE